MIAQGPVAVAVAVEVAAAVVEECMASDVAALEYAVADA